MPEISTETAETSVWILEEVMGDERWTERERNQIEDAIDELNELFD